MKIAVLKECQPYEGRVALTPDAVKKMVALNHEVVIEAGAGVSASFRDQDFEACGAIVKKNYQEVCQGASLVLKVQRPLHGLEGSRQELQALDKGTCIIGLLSPYTIKEDLEIYNRLQLTSFSLEFVPRISRAQSMDVLSSQSNLAGYRAVIEAASLFKRAFPMMMTAAGTVAPARVLVLGAGVAGLQAIATAKRLGAIVSAFDVREAAKEQVESLGATFVAVEASQNAETEGGYAKEMDDTYRQRQSDKIADVLKTQDIVIATALIPGKTAPRLVTDEMLKAMKPGSVLVDMAVESGGNIEGSRIGEIFCVHDVSLVGYSNLPSRIPYDASQLYARNLLNFLALITTSQGTLDITKDDVIVKDTLLTHGGHTVNPRLL